MAQNQMNSAEAYSPAVWEAVNGKSLRLAAKIQLETQRGGLSLYVSPSADQISRLGFDPQLGAHSGLGSPFLKRETLMRRADEDESVVAVAVNREEKIVGFCTIANPEPDRRWAKLHSKSVMSVEIVEVARDWRDTGVGRELLRAAFRHSGIEDKIIYMEGYTWTWDLEGTKMKAAGYREMMKRLFESFQFAERKTNEPNISLDGNNLFMCRVGKDVDKRLREDFKWLAFGLGPH